MIDRIEQAMQEAEEERRLDFDACVRMDTERITIDTRISRDPSKSSNGGDYYFWEEIWKNYLGEVLMRRFASCDFWQPEQEPELLSVPWAEIVILVNDAANKYHIPVIRA